MTSARVVSVGRDDRHRFSKPPRESITLVAGHGVEGDAHAGATVQHVSRVRRDPAQPNLRQVHLIHREMFDEVTADVAPGDLGENVTTAGIALLDLPRGTRLRLGDEAVVEVTGLRNPCVQIERFEPGLLREVVGTDADGTVVRRTGIMAIVVAGGVVRPDDAIVIDLPDGEHQALGDEAVVEVTGLRNPCVQIERFEPGLLKEVVHADADGRVVRRTGVMAIVVAGGVVRPDDAIAVELPDGAHEALDVV